MNSWGASCEDHTVLSQSSVEDIRVYFSLSLSSDHRLCMEKKMDGI